MNPRVLLAGSFILMGVALAGCGGEPEPSASDIARAQQAAKDLGSRLQKELKHALEAGGPVSAIEVCRAAAPAIADEVSEGSALAIRRTAIRLRNAANAPDDWERGILERFLEAAAHGKDPANLEHAEIVQEEGQRVFRWMKAIPTGQLCVQCHGASVAPEVDAAIKALYPEDQATGFAPGEIRGAFSARKVL